MTNFNRIERAWEAKQLRQHEADYEAASRDPTLIERRQTLMTRYCKMMGWPAIVAVSNNEALANGASFAEALGGTADKLPRPTHGYRITPKGFGVWNLTHRGKRKNVH